MPARAYVDRHVSLESTTDPAFRNGFVPIHGPGETAVASKRPLGLGGCADPTWTESSRGVATPKNGPVPKGLRNMCPGPKSTSLHFQISINNFRQTFPSLKLYNPIFTPILENNQIKFRLVKNKRFWTNRLILGKKIATC